MARRRLRDHQLKALAYALTVQHPALFMEMRLGKTLVAIRAIQHRQEFPVLIAMPFSAFGGWIEDLQKDGTHPSDIVELDGTAKQRAMKLADGLDSGAKYFLFNKEGHSVIPMIKEVDWGTVVLDESTFVKSPKAQVTKFYTKNFRNVKHRYILTGTPMTESELDYFCQLHFLNENILGQKNYWEFRNKHFRPSGFHGFTPTHKGKAFITERIAKSCFFMKRKEVDLGGEKIYEKRVVKQTPQFHRIQREVIKTFLLTDGNGTELASTMFATQKFIWLRRLCGGFLDGKLVYNAKINELIELITGELNNERAIILCVFTEEIDLCYDRIIKVKKRAARIHGGVPPVKRRELLAMFQKGQLDFLIAQPECFKYGVNASSANTEIYYSTPTSLETRQQSEDRVIDVSKKDSALIIDLMVKNSIEVDIYDSLMAKEDAEQMWRRIINRLQGAST